MPNELDILNVQISKVDYSDILVSIKNTLIEGKQIVITGANVNTINLALENLKFWEVLSKIYLVHPDGIGVFLASKFLFGKKGFTKRITGSDFYIELIKESLKNNWSLFFFGDTDETLSKISPANPNLKVKGFCNGFNFDNNELIKNINAAKPDILIVGLGSPKQEEWIVNIRDKISVNVIIAVGDGIKVFGGTKTRGPKIIQKLGLEWLVRLINEPKRLWKRYIIGIPLFIFRVIRFKLTSNKFG